MDFFLNKICQTDFKINAIKYLISVINYELNLPVSNKFHKNLNPRDKC